MHLTWTYFKAWGVPISRNSHLTIKSMRVVAKSASLVPRKRTDKFILWLLQLYQGSRALIHPFWSWVSTRARKWGEERTLRRGEDKSNLEENVEKYNENHVLSTPKRFSPTDGEISKRYVCWDVTGPEIVWDFWKKSKNHSRKDLKFEHFVRPLWK